MLPQPTTSTRSGPGTPVVCLMRVVRRLAILGGAGIDSCAWLQSAPAPRQAPVGRRRPPTGTVVAAGSPRPSGRIDQLMPQASLWTDIITQGDALRAQDDAWAELWRDSDATPFQSPAWAIPWWETYGVGQLQVVTCREGRDLVAIAP